MSLYPALLAPPLAMLAYDCYSQRRKSASDPRSFHIQFVGAFLAGVVVLLLMSWFLMDFSWTFLASSYGVQLLLVDLTPNIGLWWYFFIEMFDSFREFFLGVFWLHMASYVGAMTIRIRRVLQLFLERATANLAQETAPLRHHLSPWYIRNLQAISKRSRYRDILGLTSTVRSYHPS